MYRAFQSLVKFFISFIKTPLLIVYCYSLFVIVAGSLSLFTSYSAYAGKPSTTISFASSPDAGKLAINEINVVEGYVEFYVKETVNIQDWALYYEGQGNSSGSATLCSAPSNCTYNAGTFLVIEGVYLHNTLEELLVLDENFLAVHYFRYANNGNQGGGSWEWETDDPNVSTIYYSNGKKSNLCSKPDGELNTGNWQECDSTKGGPNEGETIDHYEIIHDGSGSTCATETVTIRACLDASCSVLGTESLSVDFQVNGITISSPTFTGSTSVDIDYGFEESVSFSLTNESELPSNPLECDSGSGTSCDMSFSSSGCPAVKSCAAIFPGDLTFAVNGSSTFFSGVDDSNCNGGGCSPISTFEVPTVPSIISSASFTNTSISDGAYQYTSWGLADNTVISFSGSGTAVLYFDNSITIPTGTQINVGGDPSNVLIVVNGSLTIEDGVDIKANIYVSGSASLGTMTDGANITGALSVGGAIGVYGDGVYQFQQSYINDMDSHGFCEDSIPVIDHYQIIHDGQGLTCEAETITIKACTNADCSTVSSESVSLEFNLEDDLHSSPTFTGSVDIQVSQTTPANNLTLSVSNESVAATNPFECDNGVGNSCDIDFSDAGFRFLYETDDKDVIANQTAGDEFKEVLKLQAVKSENGVCTGLFTGDKTVNLSQQNVTPDDNDGLNFTIDGDPIGKHTSFSAVTLDFGANSIATIPTPRYLDAGEIRLHASYSDSGVSLVGSSESFWVRPHHFAINAVSCDVDTGGCTAHSTTTQKAGENFDLTISALNSNGDVTQNYRQTDGQLQLKLTRVSPTISGSADGDLTYASGQTLTSDLSANFGDYTVTNFIAGANRGISEFSGAKYSEVGIINLDVRDANYGGQNYAVEASDINIGRFIPAYFEQTVIVDEDNSINDNGTIVANHNASCLTKGWAYSGQQTSGIGTIQYGINPKLTITAKNANGFTTLNYIGDFAKLEGIKATPAVADNKIIFGAPETQHLNSLEVTGDVTIDADNLTDFSAGIATYTLSEDNHFTFTRNDASKVAPFIANFEIPVDTIEDSDGVNTFYNSIEFKQNPLFSEATDNRLTVKFGRLIIDNAYGPETENLPVPMFTQFWDGSEFVTNTDDSCTIPQLLPNVDDAKVTTGALRSGGLSEWQYRLVDVDDGNKIDPDDTGASVQGMFSSGVLALPNTNEFSFSAPDDDERGSLEFEYQVPSWLQYDWTTQDGSFDESPTAIITFGLFRGNDRIISWREVGN